MMREDASEDESRDGVRPTGRPTLCIPVVKQRLNPERCSREDNTEDPDAEQETADTNALLEDRNFAPSEWLLAEVANALAARANEQKEENAGEKAVVCDDVHARGERMVLLRADLGVAWRPRQTEGERAADNEGGAEEEGGREGAHGGGGEGAEAVESGGGGGGWCGGGDGARL